MNRLKHYGTSGRIYNILQSNIITLPCPVSLSIWWNFGSCLGLILLLQVIRGLFLRMHYCSDIALAFDSISHIIRDVNLGWLLRYLHANGASFFFIALYLHIARGVYYGSYMFIIVWYIGVGLLLLSMAVAFLGYTLPWGQIRFWGATVITNLLSALPYVGNTLVYWLWGGFAVDNATLYRFFTLHFMLPFVLLGLAGLHIWFLHFTGSNNPLGISASSDIIPFHCYFTIKDIFGFCLFLRALLLVVLFYPLFFMEAENFVPANAMVTPPHIVPEWYFLFAYAILRCIPSKLGGVLALLTSILVLLTLCHTHTQAMKGLSFYGLVKLIFWSLVSIFWLLTLCGALPMEAPFTTLVRALTIFYFAFFATLCIFRKFWDLILS